VVRTYAENCENCISETFVISLNSYTHWHNS